MMAKCIEYAALGDVGAWRPVARVAAPAGEETSSTTGPIGSSLSHARQMARMYAEHLRDTLAPGAAMCERMPREWVH